MVKIISSIFLCQVLLKSEIESAIKIEFKTEQLEARICIVNNDYGRVWSKKNLDDLFVRSLNVILKQGKTTFLPQSK